MNARRKKVERRRSVVVVDKSWFELESANRRVLFQLFENGFTKEKVRRLETIGRRIRALPQFLGTMVLSEYLARPAKERRRAALVLDEEYEGLLYEVVEKLENIIKTGVTLEEIYQLEALEKKRQALVGKDGVLHDTVDLKKYLKKHPQP
jgi:hypothetical protein